MSTLEQSLNYTREAQHRVIIGLGWDPAEPNFFEKTLSFITGKDIHHDLDLSCYVYDAEKQFINEVSANSGHEVDLSGKIYHSGDNVEGLGEGDDEEISVELKNIPNTVHHIIFTAMISTNHSFKEILAPEMRLRDAYTNRVLFHSDLATQTNTNHDAFTFLHIYRDDNEWKFKPLEIFVQKKHIDNWPEYLKSAF